MEKCVQGKLFFVVFILILSLNINAQDRSPHNGRVPNIKKPHTKSFVNNQINSFQQWGTAYGWSSINYSTLSIPIPEGTPFTWLAYWTPPEFASSAVRGNDGNYYVVDVGPPSTLWTMEPNTGFMTELGVINGIEPGGSVNGIAVDPCHKMYLAAGVFLSTNNLYELNINTLNATLVGSFLDTAGAMIDIAINGSGIGYGYDIVDDNAYKFNPITGEITLLGPIGYDANYGQGMDIDVTTSTIYLSAFNNSTVTGQLRTMNPNTGASTLLFDWGFEQIAPFAINNAFGCQPGAYNPYPANGAIDVNIDTQLSWVNVASASYVEVYFGTPIDSLALVYSGVPVTTWNPGTLEYNTTYYWQVVVSNIYGTYYSLLWHFKTIQNPAIVFETAYVYPQSVAYWTGSTDGTTKTDGEINTVYPKVGWAVFDINSISSHPEAVVDSIRFFGYVNSNFWPHWSATPMDTINPVTNGAALIKNKIYANYMLNTAYIFSNEQQSLTTGWHNYQLGYGSNSDLNNAMQLGQGWFAMGFIDRDFFVQYYLNFDGWSQAYPPYLKVNYHYIPLPVEMTFFTAKVIQENVVLNWSTATEINNKGFQVERMTSTNNYQNIAFVDGHGTSTQQHDYSFTDKKLADGKYTYRIKQLDYDGKNQYSRSVKVSINAPKEFSLSQNYPDPFNPATTIKYSIPSDGPVSLQIYDLLGREVKILVNENQKAGNYSVKFDGSNLSSGIYIYRIQTGKYLTAKKMILIK